MCVCSVRPGWAAVATIGGFASACDLAICAYGSDDVLNPATGGVIGTGPSHSPLTMTGCLRQPRPGKRMVDNSIGFVRGG